MKLIYLAAPLDTVEERDTNQRLTEFIEGTKLFRVYLPQRDGGLYADLTAQHGEAAAAQAVFNRDLHALDECDYVLARGAERDPGVAFELGVAYCKGKPAHLLLRDWPLDPPKNPMIMCGTEGYLSRNRLWTWLHTVSKH